MVEKWRKAAGRHPGGNRDDGPVPDGERPAKRPPHDKEKKLPPPDKRGASEIA